MNKGVISKGIVVPIIKEGDDIIKIIVDAVLNDTKLGELFVKPGEYVKGLVKVPGKYQYDINKYDVIGITESIVARAEGNYVTVDDIAEEIRNKYSKCNSIIVKGMIYSRNRFSMILKGIARGAKKLYLDMPSYDEVGNPNDVNPMTGVNMKEYYRKVVESEGCECCICDDNIVRETFDEPIGVLYCGLHDYKEWKESHTTLDGICYTLADICSDKCEYGLLGSNKASEERLKLFPSKSYAKNVCEQIKAQIIEKTGKEVIVMVYGDGCFKCPDTGIWEFADPVCSPAYTNEYLLNSSPNEVKVKALADDKYKNLNGDELTNAIEKEIVENRGKSLVGNMVSQGTTPRRYVNLLASLMDLTSGSGDRCTPVVLVKNYFR